MNQSNVRPLLAIDLEKFVRDAGVGVDELNAAKSRHAKGIRLGRFFGRGVGREVPIQVKGRNGVAILRAQEGHAREKVYYLEVRWETSQTEVDVNSALVVSPPRGKQPTNVGQQVQTVLNASKEKKRSKSSSSAAVGRTAAAAIPTPKEMPKANKSRGGNSESW